MGAPKKRKRNARTSTRKKGRISHNEGPFRTSWANVGRGFIKKKLNAKGKRKNKRTTARQRRGGATKSKDATMTKRNRVQAMRSVFTPKAKQRLSKGGAAKTTGTTTMDRNEGQAMQGDFTPKDKQTTLLRRIHSFLSLPVRLFRILSGNVSGKPSDPDAEDDASSLLRKIASMNLSTKPKELLQGIQKVCRGLSQKTMAKFRQILTEDKFALMRVKIMLNSRTSKGGKRSPTLREKLEKDQGLFNTDNYVFGKFRNILKSYNEFYAKASDFFQNLTSKMSRPSINRKNRHSNK